MNADHEEAVEFAKISKRENRVYVGNLSYDVKYRDLMEFMRGGGWGNLGSVFRYLSCGRQRGAWQWAMMVLAESVLHGEDKSYWTSPSLPGGMLPFNFSSLS
jgi:hypothetical protein